MNQSENAIAAPPAKHTIFLLAVTLLVYAQVATFKFLNLDDSSFIVTNAYAHHWQSLPSYFAPGLGDFYEKGISKIPSFYRPVSSSWILINYQIFGLHPAWWHLNALALYALNVWLFWRIAWKLSQDAAIALAAALIFALHPLHVEGVAWLAGACVEPLMSAFFLAGLLAYLRWREAGRAIWLILSCLFALCALLSKETAAALPVLIVAHALIFRLHDGGTESRSRVLWPLVAMAATAGAYMLMRTSAIHAVVATGAGHTWGDVLRTAPLLFVTYLKQAFWPAKLAMWYDVGVVTQLTAANFYLPLAICLAYAMIMLWALVRKPLIGFLLLWWVVGLSVPMVAVLVFPDFEIVHDRFTFVALGGLCLLVASVLRKLPAIGPEIFGFKAASAIAMAIIAAVLGLLTARQVDTWRADIPLFVHAIQVSPHNVRPRVLLATEFVKRNQMDQAFAIYRDALNMDPNRWDVLFTYGMALAKIGNRPEAEKMLARSIEVGPAMTPGYLVLSDLLLEDGKTAEAVKLLEQGVRSAREPEFVQRQLAAMRRSRPTSAIQP